MKKEYFVVLDIKNWNIEMKILRLFEDDIKIVDREDPVEKNKYCEILVECEEVIFEKYSQIRKIMLDS